MINIGSVELANELTQHVNHLVSKFGTKHVLGDNYKPKDEEIEISDIVAVKNSLHGDLDRLMVVVDSTTMSKRQVKEFFSTRGGLLGLSYLQSAFEAGEMNDVDEDHVVSYNLGFPGWKSIAMNFLAIEV